MAVSPFDSGLYRDLFHDAEIGKLFTDSAEVRAMLLVEGALAKVQGKLGVIPEESAAFIHRATLEIQIDPTGLAAETGESAVCIPALVKAFRKAMEAPEHAQYAHWGATSQDIIDTGLILRLRQALTLMDERLVRILARLGTLAETHADLPMAARTWGQVATPTSFGAVVASWGQPLLRHRERLAELRPRLLNVSLAGASGTLSAMGDKGAAVRADLAAALGLGDPGESWHSTRDTVAELSAWMTAVAGSLAKMGEDLLLMSQTGIGEIRLGQGGGSSTMPQKQNPVGPGVMVALARQMVGLNANMQTAAQHRQQRDGATWLVEWMSLPQITMALARALDVAESLATTITPVADRMEAGIDDGLGLTYAEALSFALAAQMPRPDAQAAVKALCKEAQESQTPLAQLANREWPGTDWAVLCSPAAQMGDAPQQAHRFAEAAKAQA
ncbi:class-II fumarase/aspartase family protein [Actibacterium lipolyticum]|uniref:3-carboxy-cis,cis-muconate cycloisomerase n=1 Tax=Actibacterium lipolyticum TaxID=1524263 RepID=A0A238JME3_9RHOB|nr:adenylosuccinate lyase family protein [Actibacterium lipolyticum]SMX31593.1 3-carboxy-cis,cis-muconate cycloisomerase [Actibacterium lipolyticum]